MSEWVHAQTDPSQQLAQLHYFSFCQGNVDFVITVKEFATRNQHGMRFFAQADKQTNQKTAPFTPCGWGDTLLKALSECMQAIHRCPYEGDAGA